MNPVSEFSPFFLGPNCLDFLMCHGVIMRFWGNYKSKKIITNSKNYTRRVKIKIRQNYLIRDTELKNKNHHLYLVLNSGFSGTIGNILIQNF